MGAMRDPCVDGANGVPVAAGGADGGPRVVVPFPPGGRRRSPYTPVGGPGRKRVLELLALLLLLLWALYEKSET